MGGGNKEREPPNTHIYIYTHMHQKQNADAPLSISISIETFLKWLQPKLRKVKEKEYQASNAAQ